MLKVLDSLDRHRIAVNDVVFFKLAGNVSMSGQVVDSSDPSLLRVRLSSGREIKIGRGSVTGCMKGKNAAQASSTAAV